MKAPKAVNCLSCYTGKHTMDANSSAQAPIHVKHNIHCLEYLLLHISDDTFITVKKNFANLKYVTSGKFWCHLPPRAGRWIDALVTVQDSRYLSRKNINMSTGKTVSVHITFSGSSTGMSNNRITNDCNVAFCEGRGGEIFPLVLAHVFCCGTQRSQVCCAHLRWVWTEKHTELR